ncbi:hypothetical protein HDV04_004505 [Boothiomyces sp. JEL0838]|nr:hypothetical protein HDV04_004505 [Boothiomyces sp. JEL0838]
MSSEPPVAELGKQEPVPELQDISAPPPAYPTPSSQPAAQDPMVVQPPFGKEPMLVTCPFCKQSGITKTTERVGTGAFAIGCLVCLICWPCAWVPCVMCQDVDHNCSNCGAKVGEKPGLG